MRAEFLDSNILIYMASGAADKADRARDLLESGCVISVQVLNELVHVIRRKFGFSWAETIETVDRVRKSSRIVEQTEATHLDGLRLAQRYGFATYDAMIVAAALEAGCATLWSEDMHDGLLVDGRLRIRNPFAAQS